MSGLSQSTNLYIEFWTSINSSNENQEDVAKLNDLGTKINKVVADIKTNFDKMQKLKHNDELVIRIYSDFLLDILNEKEKGLYYQNRLKEIEGTNDNEKISEDKDINLDHLISDDFQYIMITAENEKPNIIKKLTTEICSLFGYSKEELIGQPIDILMPEQYQKIHKKILQNKLDEYKKFVANNLHAKKKRKFKKVYKDVFGMAKNKSKYLVPIKIQANLITSADQSEIYFIGKIKKVTNNSEYNINNISSINNQISLGNNLNNNIVLTDSVCYVLTDCNFIVQNFSPNTIFILGLKAKFNGVLDITKFIKELYEDIDLNKIEDNLQSNNNLNSENHNFDNEDQFLFNNNDSNSPQNFFKNEEFLTTINNAKRHIINTKYKNKIKINWRVPGKLKEKVAFMNNIISLNEKKKNENFEKKSSKSNISNSSGEESAENNQNGNENKRKSKLSKNIFLIKR